MKVRKRWFLSLPLVLFTGWAIATQEPKKAIDQGSSPRGEVRSNLPRPRFLKLGDSLYIDTSRILYVVRHKLPDGTTDDLTIRFQDTDARFEMTDDKNIAALLRWLDGESFSPPPES